MPNHHFFFSLQLIDIVYIYWFCFPREPDIYLSIFLFIYKEIYYKELAHTIMEAEKF